MLSASADRPVAVKVVRGRPPSAGELLARRLRHPHLLTVYGVYGVRTAFSTVEMEYCGRLTLQALLDTAEQPLPAASVARWDRGDGVSVASGIAGPGGTLGDGVSVASGIAGPGGTGGTGCPWRVGLPGQVGPNGGRGVRGEWDCRFGQVGPNIGGSIGWVSVASGIAGPGGTTFLA